MQGYRVLVVEQTETPEQLELRRKEKGSKDKVAKERESQVWSRSFYCYRQQMFLKVLIY